jgi:hypothetical protein
MVAMRPYWDHAAMELWWKGECIRRYRHDAASQCRVLDAFEENDWARRINDPLPRQGRGSIKVQLHDAIKRLNAGQKRLLFRGDGSGRGVRWVANG